MNYMNYVMLYNYFPFFLLFKFIIINMQYCVFLLFKMHLAFKKIE